MFLATPFAQFPPLRCSSMVSAFLAAFAIATHIRCDSVVWLKLGKSRKLFHSNISR